MPDGDEIYRLKHCKECGETVYTGEFFIDKTDSFMKTWNENHRDFMKNRKTNQRRPRYTKAEIIYMKKNCTEKPRFVAEVLGRSVDSVRKYMAKFRKEKKKK
jgi:hypothetical protein